MPVVWLTPVLMAPTPGSSGGVLQIKAAIAAWSKGTYAADRAKFYHEGATIDAGPGTVQGFGQVTYATIDQWCVV